MASGSYTRLLGTVFIADASDPVFLAEMPASVVGRPPPASGGQSRWEVVGGRVTATRAGQPLAQQTKRHRFAMEYLKDSNGAQAAVRAGFSATHRNVTARRLLQRADVQAAVKAGEQTHLAGGGLSAERIRQELGRTHFSMPGGCTIRPATPRPITLSRSICV